MPEGRKDRTMAARINAILNIYAALVMAVLLLGCVRTKQDRRKKSIRFIWVVLACIVYLLSNAAAYTFIYRNYLAGGVRSDLGIPFNLVECLSYISYYILLTLVVFYVVDLVRENAAVPAWLPKTTIPAAVLGAGSWCISSFMHLMGRLDSTGYRPGPLYWLGQLSGNYILGLLIFLIVRYRKTLGHGRVAIFSFFVAIPAAAVILRQYFPFIDYLSLALALSVIFVRNLLDIERARTVNQQEERLREGRVRLMLSQIRPHFLYNTLNTIYVLCEQEPTAAQRAIEELSEFLRANIGSLESDRPVPFDTEMKLVRHYLYLEQMRYQEDLRVEIFQDATNFSLPPLTIQPLVENAVKHGLAKAPGGGTVRVYSFELPNEFSVVVEDDGVGFTPEDYLKGGNVSLSEDGKKQLHIGLLSVRERLREMCGGDLEVQSKPGEGTIARIHLPKG